MYFIFWKCQTLNLGGHFTGTHYKIIPKRFVRAEAYEASSRKDVFKIYNNLKTQFCTFHLIHYQYNNIYVKTLYFS